jgi:hypothetical protein
MLLACCLLAALLGFAVGSCGGEEEDSCEARDGTICSNCAGSDCDIECAAGKQETCVGLEYFSGDNPDDLRCAFCD